MADGPFGTAVSFYVWSFDFFNRGPGFSWGAELFAFGASDPFVCFCCFAFFDGDGLPQCVLDLEDGGWKDVVFARKHAVSKQCGADDPGDGDLFDLDLCCQFEPFDRSAGSWSCSRIFGRVFDGSDRLPADRIVNVLSIWRQPPKRCGWAHLMIVLRLDRMMVEKKISLQDLADRVGITQANLSKIKNNKVNAIRFSTLNKICEVLDCQPGDLLEYRPDDE